MMESLRLNRTYSARTHRDAPIPSRKNPSAMAVCDRVIAFSFPAASMISSVET
jgi:hypothetical protein